MIWICYIIFKDWLPLLGVLPGPPPTHPPYGGEVGAEVALNPDASICVVRMSKIGVELDEVYWS